jgi:hypothetical protein
LADEVRAEYLHSAAAPPGRLEPPLVGIATHQAACAYYNIRNPIRQERECRSMQNYCITPHAIVPASFPGWIKLAYLRVRN